jgi:hypothetical protein
VSAFVSSPEREWAAGSGESGRAECPGLPPPRREDLGDGLLELGQQAGVELPALRHQLVAVPAPDREQAGLGGGDLREALLDLTRQARQRGWWTAYGALDDNFIEFEAEATKISTWQPLVIPGLLQTPAYARAQHRGYLMTDEAEIERLVELRMERQKILTDDDPTRLWAVIDENAVTRSFGSAEAKAEQIQRLIDTERLDHVVVQILPMDADPHPGLAGSFVILDYDDDPSLVYREMRPSSSYEEGPAQVEERRTVFQHLSATALGPNESIAYLRRLARPK